MALPLKTTPEDLDKLSAYLRTQVGWVEIDTIKKAIPPKHVHAFKLEAVRFLGLLERDGSNVKLTEAGREYAGGDDGVRAKVMRDRLRTIPLYFSTLQWMHFGAGKEALSKTDIANYWHDNHSVELSGAQGDALTDSTVFFMRMVGVAQLARFVAAGSGRDTHLKIGGAALAEFVTGESPPTEAEEATPTTASPAPASRVATMSPDLRVNVEIHIAADAKPATIEEIFKNMRKYLISQPEATDGT